MKTSHVLASCALLLTTLASCSSAGSQGGAYIDTARIPNSLREDYESFAVNCSKCHSLSRALNAPVTNPEHWDLYVARMMRTAGSAISPNEAPHILRFLHWYTTDYHKALKEQSSAESEGAAQAAEPQSAAPREPAVVAAEVETSAGAEAQPSPSPASESAQGTDTSAGESK